MSTSVAFRAHKRWIGVVVSAYELLALASKGRACPPITHICHKYPVVGGVCSLWVLYHLLLDRPGRAFRRAR